MISTVINDDNMKTRTYNSVVNSLVGIFSAFVTIVLNFIVRIMIVKSLGEEIYGLHGLFQSITSVISLIEAGFSTAMIIHLYKPVKENKNSKVLAILNFYKKTYFIISFVFLIIGMLVNLFLLKFLVKSTIPLFQIHMYFFMYMLITPINYLTSYKISILYANQKNRIFFIISTISQLICRGFQIMILLLTKNYYFFIMLLIIEKIICNFICNKYVDKNYGYNNSSIKKYELKEKEKKEIIDTVKPIFVNNFASNIQSSSKSIMISYLVKNISFVGYYGNYQLIVGTAQLLFSQIGSAITSSFGDLTVDNDKNKLYNAYLKCVFVIDWIAILFCNGFFSCAQDFIMITFGKKFLMPISSVALIVLDLYLYLFNIPIVSIQNALGLHKEDQAAMILQAILSIFLGLVLGKLLGINGIFLGLLIPQLFLSFLNKGIIITEKAFEKTKKDYLTLIFKELFKGIIIIFLTSFICFFIRVKNILLSLILKSFVVVFTTIIYFIMTSRKNKYYHYFIDIIKSKIRRKK